MTEKIKSFEQLQALLNQQRAEGKRIVQCHGVFDLLHPGHIRHFRAAKQKGDVLVVTITPDRFVNKGPGRPVFTEKLRLETLAALQHIDYVVLNDTPDAVYAIEKVRPHIYAKGLEYQSHEKDVTGKIAEEVNEVERHGGQVYYTDDIVFSSSSLLNRHFDPLPPETDAYVSHLKGRFTAEDFLNTIESLRDLKVLVVGDAIIDEYQYVAPLGQSGKGLHMTARCMEKEVFLGGSLIIANHIAEIADSVTLLTALGDDCPHLQFIEDTLNPRVRRLFLNVKDQTSLIKKRYVLRDGHNLSKLFETYSCRDHMLEADQAAEVAALIEKIAPEYDLVLVCDFGNGFTTPNIVRALSQVPTFLAVNTQTNSGNRGYNVVTHYGRADFIALNEPELRLAAHDRHSALEEVIEKVARRLNCPHISITRGVNGVFCYTHNGRSIEIPAFNQHTVDRVGAGDCFFSLAALCLAKGYSHEEASFLGSLAAGIGVQIVGNKEPVRKAAICKYLQRVMK